MTEQGGRSQKSGFFSVSCTERWNGTSYMPFSIGSMSSIAAGLSMLATILPPLPYDMSSWIGSIIVFASSTLIILQSRSMRPKTSSGCILPCLGKWNPEHATSKNL